MTYMKGELIVNLCNRSEKFFEENLTEDKYWLARSGGNFSIVYLNIFVIGFDFFKFFRNLLNVLNHFESTRIVANLFDSDKTTIGIHARKSSISIYSQSHLLDSQK